MTRTNLQLAMTRVDEEPSPDALLEVNEAAHQVELADAAERVAQAELEAGLAQAAADADRRHADRHTDAIEAVQKEKHRHGHDLTKPRTVDGQAIEIIRAALALVAAGVDVDPSAGAEIVRLINSVSVSV